MPRHLVSSSGDDDQLFKRLFLLLWQMNREDKSIERYDIQVLISEDTEALRVLDNIRLIPLIW